MLALRFLLSEGEGASESNVGLYLGIFLLVFALMVLIGWWAKNSGQLKQEEEPAHGHDDHGHDAHAGNDHGHGHAAAADDLTELEGIGAKVSKLLNGNGIYTFAQLAQADPAKLRKVLDASGYKYMEPAGWIDQAKLAAAGDTDGLKKLQESLKGGRKAK